MGTAVSVVLAYDRGGIECVAPETLNLLAEYFNCVWWVIYYMEAVNLASTITGVDVHRLCVGVAEGSYL